jgi:hypothetical protein
VAGDFELDGERMTPHEMLVLPEGDETMLSASGDAHLVLIGGEPLGHRHLYWNFVSSRKERLVQAAADWEAQRFPSVPGETEFIPLPAQRPVAG